mmetsp:Transcript_27613/g.34274  ORF Transcript_27613/g.34274 Transcript_27613/m.34274 type:complete len:115 (-) Transcript_27613:895-1239(-)
MWFLTVFHGIWDLETEDTHDAVEDTRKAVWAAFSTLVFTFFFIMMICSHWMTMRTSPGQMPKGYKQLIEDDLPKDFFQLIQLRESITAELIVRKKMRKGELSRDSIPNVEEVLS